MSLDDVKDKTCNEQGSGKKSTPLDANGRSSTVSEIPVDLSTSVNFQEKEGAKYRLGTIVGKGGMGLIYEAEDLNFIRMVAMKVLRRGEHEKEESMERFVEEAQITAQLEHPNIIPVHEMGQDAGGNVFYTMKYVSGLTLADVLSRLRKGEDEMVKQYPLGRLLTIFLKVCDGIAFAHSKGVLHNDLKPSNVMIGDYGEVLVLDWGLASVYTNDADGQKNSTVVPVVSGKVRVNSKRILEHGNYRHNKNIGEDDIYREITDNFEKGDNTKNVGVLGTPGFMAPELLATCGDDGHPDERSDIYSLGAILYSILTLQPPVMGHDFEKLITQIMEGQIDPPTKFNHHWEPFTSNRHIGAASEGGVRKLLHCPAGQIPAFLSDVAMKAMAVESADRYQAVKEMQREIEAYQEGLVWNRVYEDDFEGSEIKSFWEICGGDAEIWNNELRLCGNEHQYLLFKQALPRDVRIEFECRQESGYLDGLCCFINAIETDNWKDLPHTGYTFRYGGYHNSVNVLERAGNRLWSEAASPLNKGHKYVVLVERVDSHLKMSVNGKEVFHVIDNDPLSGTDRTMIGFLGALSDTRFSRIRIYCLGTPWKSDVLETAHRQIQKGHFTTAMDLSQEVIESYPDAERLRRALDSLETAKKRKQIQLSIPMWREKLTKAWRGSPVEIRMENDGVMVDISHADIDRLDPLRGIPVSALYCNDNTIRTLDPLRGMPLKILNCGGNPITSLEPLRGMTLGTLICEGCPVESLAPLRGMPLKLLNCGGAKLNTGLEPLRSMPLNWLCCWGSGVTTLEPIKGMALTTLFCNANQIETLEPLCGMPLERLVCSGNRIESLEPLRNMHLTVLHCADNCIADLEPIATRTLRVMSCQSNKIRSLLPLKDLRLSSLACGNNDFFTIETLVNHPPQSFLFDSDTIDTGELEWMLKKWSRDFRYAHHAKNVEVLLAMRTQDQKRLRKLATTYNGKRYLFVPKFMTWDDAVACCHEFGGHLVTISNKDENAFIVSLLPGSSWFWIGLAKTDDGLKWVNGEPFKYGAFVDNYHRDVPGGKVFTDGIFTAEVSSRAQNPFVIEWVD